MRSSTSLLVLITAAAAVAAPRPAGGPASGYSTRTVSLGGYTWRIKIANPATGPGPNYFSDSSDNVWQDSAGVHLKISRRMGRWFCAEIVLNQNLGYGTYRFDIDTPSGSPAIGALDPNVVLGLFTWSDPETVPTDYHQEIDIEFARWGNPAYPNGYYTIQPYTAAGNQATFQWPASAVSSSHQFTWTASSTYNPAVPGADFQSADTTGGAFRILKTASFPSADSPQTKVQPYGGARARINLWLFNGKAPSNGRATEVIIRSFTFTPGP